MQEVFNLLSNGVTREHGYQFMHWAQILMIFERHSGK